MSIIRDGKSRDCGVCYWCDFATCMYNGKKCKGKMRVRHCPIYRKVVKSKYNKAIARQLNKKIVKKENNNL